MEARRIYLYERYLQKNLHLYFQSSPSQESEYEQDKKAALSLGGYEGMDELLRIVFDISIRTNTNKSLYIMKNGHDAYDTLIVGKNGRTPLDEVESDLDAVRHEFASYKRSKRRAEQRGEVFSYRNSLFFVAPEGEHKAAVLPSASPVVSQLSVVVPPAVQPTAPALVASSLSLFLTRVFGNFFAANPVKDGVCPAAVAAPEQRSSAATLS
jgi:hypothetical protein